MAVRLLILFINPIFVINANEVGQEEFSVDFTLQGNQDDRLEVVDKMNNGNLILAGRSSSKVIDRISGENYGGFDVIILNLNQNNDIVWSRFLGGTGDDLISDLINVCLNR